MFSSVCFSKNQFSLHILHTHTHTHTCTHTLNHPWHFLPFQIIILTTGKPFFFFFLFWLCDFDFWLHFTLDDDLLMLHWNYENSLCCDFHYVINSLFLMTAASFPGSASPFPFAPHLGNLIRTSVCVLHHLTDGHFKQCKHLPGRVPDPSSNPH